MIPTTFDVPERANEMMRLAKEGEANEGRLYRQLTAAFDEARRMQHTPQPQWAPQPTTKREAIAQSVDIAYALAGSILQTPADHPAHAIDFAIGLLNEAMTYVRAEIAARDSN